MPQGTSPVVAPSICRNRVAASVARHDRRRQPDGPTNTTRDVYRRRRQGVVREHRGDAVRNTSAPWSPTRQPTSTKQADRSGGHRGEYFSNTHRPPPRADCRQNTSVLGRLQRLNQSPCALIPHGAASPDSEGRSCHRSSGKGSSVALSKVRSVLIARAGGAAITTACNGQWKEPDPFHRSCPFRPVASDKQA